MSHFYVVCLALVVIERLKRVGLEGHCGHHVVVPEYGSSDLNKEDS